MSAECLSMYQCLPSRLSRFCSKSQPQRVRHVAAAVQAVQQLRVVCVPCLPVCCRLGWLGCQPRQCNIGAVRGRGWRQRERVTRQLRHLALWRRGRGAIGVRATDNHSSTLTGGSGRYKWGLYRVPSCGVRAVQMEAVQSACLWGGGGTSGGCTERLLVRSGLYG